MRRVSPACLCNCPSPVGPPRQYVATVPSPPSRVDLSRNMTAVTDSKRGGETCRKLDMNNGGTTATSREPVSSDESVFSVDGHRAFVSLTSRNIAFRYTNEDTCCVTGNTKDVIPFSEILAVELVPSPNNEFVSVVIYCLVFLNVGGLDLSLE